MPESTVATMIPSPVTAGPDAGIQSARGADQARAARRLQLPSRVIVNALHVRQHCDRADLAPRHDDRHGVERDVHPQTDGRAWNHRSQAALERVLLRRDPSAMV